MSPRVLIVIRRFHPDVGGAERQAMRLAAQLIQDGVEVTVLTGRYGNRSRYELLNGVRVQRLFIGLQRPVIHELFFLLSLTWYLIRRRHEYDIIHLFQTQLSAFIAVLFAKQFHKQVMTRAAGTGHTGDMAVLSSVPGGRWILRQIARNVNATVALSSQIAEELKHYGFNPATIHHIPNGVPLPQLSGGRRVELRQTLGLPLSRFIVLYVGRLSEEKGVGLLLEGWKDVCSRHPDTQLVLVGNGPLRTFLDTYVTNHCLSEHVRLVGEVDNVNDYFFAADAFALSSLNEGLSNALLEAMATGLPVVASRTSGTTDIIQDHVNGLLFDVGDLAGLVDALSDLIASPSKYAGLGINARRTVERDFSIEHVADLYRALYIQMLDQSPTSKVAQG